MAVLAGIVEKGKLVSKKQWQRHIRRLKASTTELIRSKQAIKKTLREAITEAVKERMPRRKFGVMLSGGVDSSLIAFTANKLKGNFICYSVGIEGSRDLAEAKKAAKKLKLNLRYMTYSLPEVENVIKKAVKVVGEANVVNVGVASVEIAAAQLAKKDKINVFFGGIGSEEIFAGYQRHAEAKDVTAECWSGLIGMWERDLVRDAKVAEAMKISFLTPFLDKELIVAAMEVPAKYKISKSEKKIILRETARDMGLPEDIAFRKKLAAQYGSGFDRAMEKLAKRSGFKRKKDYLKSLL